MTTHRNRLVVAGLIAVGMAGCAEGEAAEDTGSTLQLAEVTIGDLVISAEATGTVEPVREVEVKSKASGEILRLHVDIGDEVAPGALLADIDPRDVQNRFDQMEADLAVAEARMEIGQAQLERSDQLLTAQVITPQEHESARLEYANSQASLVRAETNFVLAELQLNDVRIRAPMSGTIIQKNVEEGVVIQSASGNVSGGTTLFIMADLSEMQVRTLVDETDMGELEPGMETTVNVEAFPDRTFRGVVDKIEPQAEVVQNVTMFPVIVSIDNRAGLLRPGMNAEVEVFIDEAVGVVLVPNNAIVQTSDVGPAAMALGLDIEEMDLTQFLRAGFAGRGGGQRGGGQRGGDGQRAGGGQRGGAPTGAEDGSANPQGQPGAGAASGGTEQAGGEGDVVARLQALRAQVDAGEITQDSMRAVMASLGGNRGFGGRGRGGAAAEGAAPPRESRPAVVFVLSADSIPEPRLIQIGLNDWDRTQVVSGVDDGETLVVVGAAQLMAQQQEYLDRLRERMGGGSPFGGGSSGRGGRGR
jgi:HlyD family secretion protein